MENSAAIATPISKVWQRVRYYWSLIKVMQTALLVMTGVAGFLTFKCPITNLATLTAVFLTLAGSISGTTILNMWYDRDIDALMNRTRKRPLAMQNMHHREALLVGLALVGVSVAAAFAMNRLYGAIIFAGVLFDFLVYTIWLKGHIGLQVFENDTDTTTIDSHPVFLMALANAKQHYRQPDAQSVFRQLEVHIGNLNAGTFGLKRFIPSPPCPVVRDVPMTRPLPRATWRS